MMVKSALPSLLVFLIIVCFAHCSPKYIVNHVRAENTQFISETAVPNADCVTAVAINNGVKTNLTVIVTSNSTSYELASWGSLHYVVGHDKGVSSKFKNSLSSLLPLDSNCIQVIETEFMKVDTYRYQVLFVECKDQIKRKLTVQDMYKRSEDLYYHQFLDIRSVSLDEIPATAIQFEDSKSSTASNNDQNIVVNEVKPTHETQNTQNSSFWDWVFDYLTYVYY